MFSFMKILCLYGFLVINIFIGDTAQPRIIGGSSIIIRKRPFMVSLHHKISGFHCGGSIIDKEWVLSAYHCLSMDESPAVFFLRAGSTFNNKGGSLHKIIKPVYYNDTETLNHGIPINDLVLLKVKPNFHFSKKMKPVKLPKIEDDAPDKLWVSGWGQTNSEDVSRELRTVQLNNIDYEMCLDGSPWYQDVLSNVTHLCYSRPRQDACYGDSGGPLADRDTIYGIVSFGDGCAKAPGVYTKVSHYVNWIKEVINTS